MQFADQPLTFLLCLLALNEVPRLASEMTEGVAKSRTKGAIDTAAEKLGDLVSPDDDEG